ncbi:DUF4247 domain-containing protein [Salininema proteolyticum]|uniref:DUF4247 domain-containing protein n=1 Tax=Salininema proteolyticum TaxID=1607685 RepID=A0ABV8TWN1_9ACTN
MTDDRDLEDRPKSPSAVTWIVIAVIAALCISVVFVACNNKDDDPTDYISANYTRDASKDSSNGDARVYTSSRSPKTVADDIDDNTDERSEKKRDGIYFLQYDRHIVSVESEGSGSKILVFPYRKGSTYYGSYFGFFGWSSSPPGGSRYRGGGSGFGK